MNRNFNPLKTLSPLKVIYKKKTALIGGNILPRARYIKSQLFAPKRLNLFWFNFLSYQEHT